MATKFNVSELKKFFRTQEEIQSRIEEIAPLCTDIAPRETVVGYSLDFDDDVWIRVYSSECDPDNYYFPLEYLSLDNDEIRKREEEKAERLRRLVEAEELKERKRKEREERKEYERLKKKFEGKDL